MKRYCKCPKCKVPVRTKAEKYTCKHCYTVFVVADNTYKPPPKPPYFIKSMKDLDHLPAGHIYKLKRGKFFG